MINAVEMQQIYFDKKPHNSHKMTAWEDDMVACASNDRFGQVRSCCLCEGRDVKAGGADSRYWDSELFTKCAG